MCEACISVSPCLDLFDDEGFSLSDINELVLKRQCDPPEGSVLSAEEEDSDAEHNSCCLAMEEHIDLEKVKVCIVHIFAAELS